MHILCVLAPGSAWQLHRQQMAVALDQTAERVHDRGVVGEGMQTPTVRPQLPRRLWTAQQKQADNRELRHVKFIIAESCVAEGLLVLRYSSLEILFRAHEMFGTELAGATLFSSNITGFRPDF